MYMKKLNLMKEQLRKYIFFYFDIVLKMKSIEEVIKYN